MIISQIRDKLNVTFGETKTRSGGRALDFYASQIVWLAEIGKIKRVIDKIERVVGIDVRARVKKNKVGLPFREADYPILFGYGIDDLMADVAWLIEVGREELIKPLGMSKTGYKTRLNHLRDKGGQEVQDLRAALAKIVHEEWATIETGFLPKSTKY
jgi:recombination protein RecA